MFRTPHLVDALVECIALGESTEVRMYAMETVRNLSNQNKQAMIQSRPLIYALFDVVICPTTEQQLRSLALSCFMKLGFSLNRVRDIHKLQILCSVRDAPRVCGTGCAFQNIPNELIRKMADTLYGFGN